MVILNSTLEACFSRLIDMRVIDQSKFAARSEKFPITRISTYTQGANGQAHITKSTELCQQFSEEMRKLMVFLDRFIRVNPQIRQSEFEASPNQKFNPDDFELEFGNNPRKSDLRFAFKKLQESKIYKFFNCLDIVAELTVANDKSDQCRYVRKINPNGDLDCSKGKRIEYLGDLHGKGTVRLIQD